MARKHKDDPSYTDDPKRPREEDPRAGEVIQKFGRAQASILEELQNYWLNFLFLEGYQWVFFNSVTERIDEVMRPDEDSTRLTLNRMRASSRTIMGKLTQRDLKFEVMPTDADDAHMRGARIAESLLENLRISHSWEQKREVAAWAAWKGGISAICVDWDPEASDLAADPTDTGGRALKKGDTCETVLNLSEFVVEPGSRDAEKARWWIKCLLLPPAEVKDMYDLEWMPAADGKATLTPFQVQAMERNHMLDTPLTRVLTYYERPNKSCPEGKVQVVVNNQCVFDGKWPFPWKDHLNLAVMRETVVETRWTGDTVLSDARGIQVAFNHAHSVIDEHMKRAANARMAVPQSAVDMMDELTDQPAEIFPYPDGSVPPSWVGAPQMPQWWVERPTVLAQEMDDVLGSHQVSRGDAPVNIESGYGLSILAEHDATPIMRMSKEQAQMWSKVATMVLKLYEKMVTTKRKTVAAPVAGQPLRTLEWSGKDFKGQTTAIVPYDEIVPRSRASQLQLAREMLQMQVITSPAQFAEVADLPGQGSIIATISPDIAKARRENHMFSVGRPAVPAEFDDHEAHVIEHNRWRKSIDYELASEEIKEHVEQHIQAHITMAAEAAGQQSAAAAVGGEALAAVPTPAGAPPMDPAALAAQMAPPPAPEMPPTATEGLTPPGIDSMTVDQLADLMVQEIESTTPEE